MMILRSLSHRDAVCELVLATYRVELTSTLSRVADGDTEDDDFDRVDRLASLIVVTASAAELGLVRSDALLLRSRTAAAQAGGKNAESAMLIAGLKVIDRILDSAKVHRGKGAPRPAMWN
jgi:hypothetical protein